MRLKQISLIISFIGIITLLLTINTLQLPTTNIESITARDLNKNIKIIATISSQKSFNDFSILTIQDESGKITGICNCPQLPKNKTLEIIGKISKYENEIQININKISLSK
jgi:RecJ-like exonuclease